MHLTSTTVEREDFHASLVGLNLTEEVNDQFISTDADREVTYTHTRRQFFEGARYKF